jgi:serine acetyltransferase
MAHRLRRAAEQIGWLSHEVQLLIGGRWWRWYTVWAGGAVWTVVSYRVDRAMYLLVGRAWALLRPFFLPLFLFFRLMGARGEIHYRASIGRGLRVLHPVLGVVVSARAVIGTNLTLVGGNCVGGRPGLADNSLTIGNDVTLGANAVVLGPVVIGDNVTVGAGAVVVRDVNDGATVIGVPARDAHDAPVFAVDE